MPLQQNDAKKVWLFVIPCVAAMLVVYFLILSGFGHHQEGRRLNNEVIEPENTFEIRFKNIQLEYRMHFAQPCSSETKILFLSMTRRDAFEKRRGIRETWMDDARSNETIRFLIADGPKTENQSVLQKLEEEQAVHGDIVYFQGFNDTYFDLHFKWYAGLQWQQTYCNGTEFVLKADDDTVIYLGRLNYWIEHKFRQIITKNPLTIIGLVHYGAKPGRVKEEKWYISESVYPLDRYPDFAQGFSYITNPASITAILSKSPEIVGFYLDDVVFTGMLADLANVSRSDQKQHFLWKTSINVDERRANCEGGVPTAISIWGIDTLPKFRLNYMRLQFAKCATPK